MNKFLDEFKSLFLIASLGIVMIVGVYTIFTSIKNWISPPPQIRTYAAPKQIEPSRPVGLVHLITTGKEPTLNKWYLRADTVMGSRTKRLAWVKIDFAENKTEKYSSDEQFHSINCETMEMRRLSAAYRKRNDTKAYFSVETPYDKAEISYPSPNTGMMALYKEACRVIYDNNPTSPV
jgi:hypothetical protein